MWKRRLNSQRARQFIRISDALVKIMSQQAAPDTMAVVILAPMDGLGQAAVLLTSGYLVANGTILRACLRESW